jgi:ABC-type nitrate/sulfonate/bicarbonate transport system substrate-binding protein
MYADVLFTSEDMVKNHPDLVRRVVKAVIEGWQYALNHPDTAIQDLRAYEPGIDAAHQLRMLDAAKTFVRPTANWKLGTMDMAVWQEMEQALLSQKLLSKPVDLSALVQSQFVDSLYDSNIK